jgi:hypothetical protein
MILLLLLIAIPVITFIIAVRADKRKAKFFFGLRHDETIDSSVNSVAYYVKGKRLADTGILYLTNHRLIFFKYRYKILGFIPFIGTYLECCFINKDLAFELPIKDVFTYQAKKTKTINNRNRSVLTCNCATTFFTKLQEEYKVSIPMSFTEYDAAKPLLLTKLDGMLLFSK